MKKIKLEIEIYEDDLVHIKEFLDQHTAQLGLQKLDLKTLAEMLMSDVALAVRRPGSWEGSNMYTVLEAHGYTF